MTEYEEIEDSRFIQLLETKRHKEILVIFNQILNSLNESGAANNNIKELVYEYNEAVSVFLNKVKEISVPNVNIETSSIESGIVLIIEGQNKLISLLEKKPVKLLVHRSSYNGLIESVEINYGNVEFKKIK